MNKNIPIPRFDNTLSVKKLAQQFDDELICNCPYGKEKQLYNVGEKIVTQSTDTFKAGLIFTITEVMEDNGYFHYFYGGSWHRQKDILPL
jgi:hypothetical protein